MMSTCPFFPLEADAFNPQDQQQPCQFAYIYYMFICVYNVKCIYILLISINVDV